MRRCLIVAVLLGLAVPAWGQTLIRVKSADGKVVCEVTIPAGGAYDITHPVGPEPLPPPTPVPVPPIQPPVVPPNPPVVVGKIVHVVVIRDDTPGAMSGAQQAVLRDAALRQQLQSKGVFWHVFDVNSVEVQQKPPTGKGYAKWLNNGNLPQALNLAAPCVFYLDAKGALVKGIPLPETSAGVLAPIQ